MNDICIGIHFNADIQRLRATVASVRANTTHAIDILLLPDGLDHVSKIALNSMAEKAIAGGEKPRGAPACFNRLAVASQADILVLLENGSLVGPGWLDHLLNALDADPNNGLAGPSTNMAWNDQCVFPRSRGSLKDVARKSANALQRFGENWRTLEPLYSLADFCYVVRREVVDTIGAADESYGLGPCWEMDYNIRAARAGFRGVWACAAFVYRPPFSARRRREEASRFSANKRRYQNKFCALQLRGERQDYEAHCKGDACEHFAPAALIDIKLPLPKNVHSVQPAQSIKVEKTLPMVSCIMPTADRAPFVLQSIRYFQRQDYPSRELIIVDDGADDLARQLPDDPMIRYFRSPSGMSIGAKRNQACELARGSVITHWDDDDWYAPNRLSAQVAPILHNEADITALDTGVFFDLDRWQFWACTSDLHRRLFVEDVHGGTLTYQRRIWEKFARFPHTSLAEDANFLKRALRRGARLRKLNNDNLFIYLRHGENSWQFACGRYLDPSGWQRLPEPRFCQEDRAFYLAHSKNGMADCAAIENTRGATTQPQVSCIMPTANRRKFVPLAIRYFQAQDYENKELIILDSGRMPVEDLVPDIDNIKYQRIAPGTVLGKKRNLACEMAAGEIICHWDDDDWHAPNRISRQVSALQNSGADICGNARLFFLDIQAKNAWQYSYPNVRRKWVAGGTLCYTRTAWQKNPFLNIRNGEDTRFVWSRHAGHIHIIDDHALYVAMIHPQNTARKNTRSRYWQSVAFEKVCAIIGDDINHYYQPLPQ